MTLEGKKLKREKWIRIPKGSIIIGKTHHYIGTKSQNIIKSRDYEKAYIEEPRIKKMTTNA